MRKSRSNLYKKCSTLPIENFYGILNTGNLAWLYKEFEDGDEYDISDEQNIELTNIWNDIHEDYIDKIGNGSETKNYMILAQMCEMEAELNIVGTLIQVYSLKKTDAIKAEIEKWEYYPDDIDKSIIKLKQVKFKMSIMKSKHKELFEESDEDIDIEYDLFNDVVVLEQSLGESKVIDVKTTVVDKWIKYVKSADAKNKRRNKN